MKSSLVTAMAGALWATVALGQVQPCPGPGSSVPAGPEDTPLVRQTPAAPPGATGLLAGLPGPYLPNPADPGPLTHDAGPPRQSLPPL